MERAHNCVMCRRGFYRGRYQRHLLTDDLPRLRPELAAYIQDNAVLAVRAYFNYNRRYLKSKCLGHILSFMIGYTDLSFIHLLVA